MAKKFISLKKEIKGIEDIKETVKTLEKISAANIHRLKIVSQNMKNYEFFLEKIFYDLEKERITHPLLNSSPATKRLNVVITTEKGLCGALLNNLIDFIKERTGKGSEFMVIGEKGEKLFKERGITIKSFFRGWEESPKEEDVRKIRNLLISDFLNKKYKEILIFYSAFESLGIQKPRSFVFLPFNSKNFEGKIEENTVFSGYPIYEPNKKKFRDYLIQEYIGLVFYQKILEAKLSELSARTVAMESASGKAKQLLFYLSHQYFREKRGVITEELNDLYSHRT